MYYEINEILLRRKRKVIVGGIDPDSEDRASKNKVLAMMKNLESFGFTMSAELLAAIMKMSDEMLADFYGDLIEKVKPLVGADKEYYPMYPNFPNQVMEMEEAELFWNAICHYWTFGLWQPEYKKDERFPLYEDVELDVLELGTQEDLMEIFHNLVSSKTNISNQDKEDVKWVLLNRAKLDDVSEDIPLRENAVLIAKIILENYPLKKAEVIQKYMKTATDVLRLVVGLSGGDMSLPSDPEAVSPKIKNMSRTYRRVIMDLLASCKNITEDMFRFRFLWVKTGEVIHPFDSQFKAERYDSVKETFKLIFADKKPLFWSGKVTEAIKHGRIEEAITLLPQRPGEMARNLDVMLRKAKGKEERELIVEKFAGVANKVATPLLLHVRQHFIARQYPNDNPVRVFFPKGNVARAIIAENNLTPIPKKYCLAIVKICEEALKENYADKEKYDMWVIDQNFKDHIVPFSQRSASSVSKQVTRGSKLKIRDNAKAIRSFIWWTNTEEGWRVDIDLSCALYSADWKFVEHISYTRLKSNGIKAYHSGDITNGGDSNGKGVSEFIDVDIESAGKKGRYLVFQIYCFTGSPFSAMNNCRFGWMEREDVNSGETFEPSTVEMVVDVNAASRIAVPVIFDCKERKYIWCDMNIGYATRHDYPIYNNLEANVRDVNFVCWAMTNLNKPNLYDLIDINRQAVGGKKTNDRNAANIIFSNDKTTPIETIIEENSDTKEKITVTRENKSVPIITTYDTDYYMGQML